MASNSNKLEIELLKGSWIKIDLFLIYVIYWKLYKM